jgi:AcrR family transcriptional regulator
VSQRAVPGGRARALTRGALYHHFAGKPALFAAVFEEALKELSIRHVDPVVNLPATGLDRLRRMVDGFLNSSLDPEMRQNVVIDGPAVLGWERFREIGAADGLDTIRTLIVEKR